MEISRFNFKIPQNDEKSQNLSDDKNEDARYSEETSDYSNFGSIGSSESFSKYVYDRTAPSFFMILAEQEISRQESTVEEEQNIAEQNAINQTILDKKLTNLESSQAENASPSVAEKKKELVIEHEIAQRPPAETKPARRETVRFQSTDVILGPVEEEEQSQQEEQPTVAAPAQDIEESQSTSDPVNVAVNEVHMDDEKIEATSVQPVK
jgi:hypothetical protein